MGHSTGLIKEQFPDEETILYEFTVDDPTTYSELSGKRGGGARSRSDC